MQAGTAFALALILGAAAFGQQPPSENQTVPRPPALAAAVSGVPFSAERHRVRTHMLEDGTRITETWPVERIARDAQGRIRTDRALLPLANAPELPRVVQIDDAAAGVQIVLEPLRKVAHRFMKISAESSHPDAEAESLGAWVIQGFRAEGRRRVTESVVTETWTAPELQFVLRQKISEPRLGESVSELTRIRTGEQDVNLFEIPPDYSVVDEPGPFAISYVHHSHASLPTLLSRVPAVYTEDARKAGIQGTVQLTLLVDEAGKAQAIRVEHSLEPGLDQEAIKAVRHWRFHPGEQDGHAVRVPVRVEVSFSLNN
ncbi:MAG TPA: energy transducer TonB [Bryobacteraceae bacterium]|jgi:TonB family protein